jgi:hypothetical protein
MYRQKQEFRARFLISAQKMKKSRQDFAGCLGLICTDKSLFCMISLRARILIGGSPKANARKSAWMQENP